MDSIYSRLRSWRFQLAREMNVPSFFILSNAHLAGIAVARPTTVDELAHCPGIGPKKLALFGQSLVDVVAASVADGLAPGVELPEPQPAPEPDSTLTQDDLDLIASGLRKELALRLVRRFKGRFSAAQVEEALRRLSLPA